MAGKKNIPLIEEYDDTPLPRTKGDRTYSEYREGIKRKNRLKKRFGKNWNREYSPTGNIGGKTDKLLGIRRARKGDRVGYRSLGEVNPGTPPTGIVGAGPSVGAMPTPAVPQKRPPSVAKQKTQEQVMAKKIDATNKIAAAKAEDAKVAQRKSLGQPQGPPQGQPPAPLGKPPGPPGMPQPQAPRAMVRKGDAIKPQGYRGGGKVYANFCRPASNPDA